MNLLEKFRLAFALDSTRLYVGYRSTRLYITVKSSLCPPPRMEVSMKNCQIELIGAAV